VQVEGWGWEGGDWGIRRGILMELEVGREGVGCRVGWLAGWSVGLLGGWVDGGA